MDRKEGLERLDAAGADGGPIEYELVHVGLLRAAAAIIRQSGWRPIADAPEGVGLFLGAYGEMGTWCSYGPAQKDFAIRCGYTHYFPEPAPPAREVENDGE